MLNTSNMIREFVSWVRWVNCKFNYVHDLNILPRFPEQMKKSNSSSALEWEIFSYWLF